jgi:hypothetical protein
MKFFRCYTGRGPGVKVKSTVVKKEFNHKALSAAEPQPNRSDSRQDAKSAKFEFIFSFAPLREIFRLLVAASTTAAARAK